MKLKENINKEQFAELLIPFFKERYEFYSLSKEELIGKELFTIRPGIGPTGVRCTVSKIDNMIHVIKLGKTEVGGLFEWVERQHALMLYTPEIYKEFMKNVW